MNNTKPLPSARRRVMTALDHRAPDRLPFAWGFGPTAELSVVLERDLASRGVSWRHLREQSTDIVWTGPAYVGPPPRNGVPGVGLWGINVKRQSYERGSYDEFTDFPLAGATDPCVLEDYPWPDPQAYAFESFAAEIERRNPGRTRAALCGGGNPFEIYCWMTGLEEAMVNLLTAPEVVDAAMERITGFFETKLQRQLQASGGLVDLVFFADDLGSQNGLLISRELYRDRLQPFHRRLMETARRWAPDARRMFHSDGAVFEILPDLIDAGVEVLEAVQTDAAGMEPERLKAAYGDRMSFHGAISVQKLLPWGSAADVTTECTRLGAVLGQQGGYIAAPAHAIQVGTPTDNVLAMLRATLGAEDFESAWQSASEAYTKDGGA